MRNYVKTMAAGLLLSAALAACSNSSAPTNGGAARADAGKSIYSFANACYALQALPSNHHVRKDGGSWAASEAGLGNAAAFFFKPTGLQLPAVRRAGPDAGPHRPARRSGR